MYVTVLRDVLSGCAGLRAWEPAAEPCPDGPRDSWVGPVPVLAIRVFSFADRKVASGTGCAGQGRLGPVRGQPASCTWPVASATGRAVSWTPLGTALGAVLPDASPARGARLVQCAGHSPSGRLGLSCQVDPLRGLQLSECSTGDDFTRPSRCIPSCSLPALGVMVLQGRGGQVQPRWPLEGQWEPEVVLPCCGVRGQEAPGLAGGLWDLRFTTEKTGPSKVSQLPGQVHWTVLVSGPRQRDPAGRQAGDGLEQSTWKPGWAVFRAAGAHVIP